MNYILCTAVLAVIMAGCSGNPEKTKLDKWYPMDEPSPPGFFSVEKTCAEEEYVPPQEDGFFGVGKEKEEIVEIRTRPEASGGIAAEFLYFKAIQDGLRYALYLPQDNPFNPQAHPLDQHFDYAPGVRVTANYVLPTCEQQEFRLNWMYYRTKPEDLQVSSGNNSILAVLAVPSASLTPNLQCREVKGDWNLTLNAFELDFKVPLHLSKRFMLSPSGGMKLGFVDQTVAVHYDDFLVPVQTDNTPTHIKGESKMWGLGPLLGLEGRVILPCDFGVFFSGGIAALAGRFSLETTYSDFLPGATNPPGESKVSVNNHEWRVSVVEQIKVGLDKRWCWRTACGHEMNLEIAAGWEVQVWTRQLRLNLFDSFVAPSAIEDLTLYGPFAKIGINF